MQYVFSKTKYLIPFFFICFTISSNAQIDNSKGNKKLNNLNVPPTTTGNLKKVGFINHEADQIEFESALQEAVYKKKQELEREQLKKKGILTRQQIHQQRADKQMAELHKKYAKIDQNLGGFSTQSKTLTIICRDHGAADNDIVTIYLNDEPIVRQIVLTNSYQEFKIPLKVGFNTISFKALNQGESGPNTATLVVFDENGTILSSKAWNLATGAKAVLTIARDQ